MAITNTEISVAVNKNAPNYPTTSDLATVLQSMNGSSSGVRPIQDGGTGNTSFTTHGAVYGDNLNGVALLASTAALATGETIIGVTGDNPTTGDLSDLGGTVAAANVSTAIARWHGPYTVGHAQLTEAGNGVAQTINLALANPADSVEMVYDAIFQVTSLFSGGSPVSVVGVLGITGSDEELLAAADMMQVGYSESDRSAVTTPYLTRITGTTTYYTFTATPDGAHNLAALSAGSLKVWIYSAVLPA